MMWLKSMRLVSILVSVALVSSALFISYVVLFPVNVLSNWTLSLPKSQYALGDTVLIQSLYTKNVDSTSSSKAERYLECDNGNGVYVRYLLSTATANRKKSKSTGTGIVVKIPDDIAEVTLPTKCFFSVSIDYDVYPRRAETEYERTKTFTLTPKSDSDPIEQQPVMPPSQPTPQANSYVAPKKKGIQGEPVDPVTPDGTPATPTAPQPDKSITGIPLVDGILKQLGGNGHA